MENPDGNKLSLIYCKHSDISHLRGDITFHICSSIKKVYKNQAEAAPKLRGVWVIVVLSDIIRSYLLQDGYLLIDERRIVLYDNRFLGDNREDTERVFIKDLPVWSSDGIIKNYIKIQSPLNKTNGIVFRSKARNNITSASSPFFNGDRYFYAQRVIDPPLPDKIKFRDHTCRIMYRSKHVVCERCHKNDYKSTDL